MKEYSCVNCGQTSGQMPLLNMIFKGEEKYICAQCLPILIHKPKVLAEKLPGFVPPINPAPDDH